MPDREFRVVTSGLGHATLRRLAAQLDYRLSLIACPDFAALPGVVRTSSSTLVVCDATSVAPGWHRVLAALLTLLDEIPGLRVVARLPQPGSDVPSIVEAQRHGIRALGASSDDALEALLLRVFDATIEDALLARIHEAARRALPESAEWLLREVLRRSHHPISVPELAATLGITTRTLRRRCVRAGLPQPESLIAWCRLMLVYRRVYCGHIPLAHAAVAYGFSSDSDARTRVRRLTGLSLHDVHDRGGLELLFAEHLDKLCTPPDQAVVLASGEEARESGALERCGIAIVSP